MAIHATHPWFRFSIRVDDETSDRSFNGNSAPLWWRVIPFSHSITLISHLGTVLHAVDVEVADEPVVVSIRPATEGLSGDREARIEGRCAPDNVTDVHGDR